MKSFFFVFCLINAAIEETATKDEHGFYILDNKNYDKFLGENPNTVVFYIDENCEGCAALERILEELSPQYQNSHPYMKKAKINYFGNEELLGKEKADEFPQLRFFVNRHFYGIFVDVIDKSLVSSFIMEQLSATPNVKRIADKGNYEKFKKEEFAIYLSTPELNEEQLRVAEDMSRTFPHFPIYVGISETDLDKKFFGKIKGQYRAMIKRKFLEEKIMVETKPIVPEVFIQLVQSFAQHRVFRLDNKLFQKLFRFRLPLVILYDDDLESERVRHFAEAIELTKPNALCLISNLKEINANVIGGIFGVTEKDLPALRILRFGTSQLHRFRLDGDLTRLNIERFVEGFLDNSLKEYYRSEPVPAEDFTTPKIIVRDNYKAFTSSTFGTTVLLILSKTSSATKVIYEAFKEFAAKQAFKADNDQRFGVLNFDTNDLENVGFNHLPLIQVFANGKLVSSMTKYTGEATQKAIDIYISQQLAEAYAKEKIAGDL